MDKIHEKLKDIPVKVEKEPILEAAGDGIVYSEQTTTPLELVKQKVILDISSGFAQTTQELTFKNNLNRELEGELQFHLKEGSSVVSYGLDIKGKIMEAVPVTKEKAKQVFEKEVADSSRDQVSIVEQVAGNVFKTRIYPITAHGTRTAKLQVIDELETWRDNIQKLWVPMTLAKSLEELNVLININNNKMTRVYMRGTNGELQTLATTKKGTVELNLKDVQEQLAKSIQGDLAGLFILSMNETTNETVPRVELCTEGDANYQYFSASCYLEKEETQQTKVSHVGVMWDTSHSNFGGNREQSMALIKAILEDGVTLTVFPFCNTCEQSKTVTSYDEFEKLIQSVPLDGGSNIENVMDAVSNASTNFDYLLLCSDGFFNVGKGPFDLNFDKPIYACSDALGCQTAVLQYISVKSGGCYFNLQEAKAISEIKPLLGASVRSFKGVLEKVDGVELYPSVPTSLKGKNDFTIYGRIDRRVVKETNIMLSSVFESSVAQSKLSINVTIEENRGDSENHSTLARLWAKRKIAQLLLFGDAYKDQILNVGVEYNMATPNTSLIVLESIEQYKKHNIRPSSHHPELRKLYDDFIAKQEKDNQNKFTKKVLDWASKFRSERYTWYTKKFKIPKPVTKNVKRDEAPHRPSPPPTNAACTAEAPLLRNSCLPPPPPPSAAQAAAEAQARRSIRLEQEECVRSRSMNVSRKKKEKKKKSKENDKEKAPEVPSFKIALKTFNGNNAYASKINQSKTPYETYLEFKNTYHNSPSFYLDVVDVFLQKQLPDLATRVLYNILELGTEDAQLLRIVGYRLDQANKLEESALVFRRVLALRPHEPQSHRDLALVLEKLGEFKEAADLLFKVIGGKWDGRFSEIQFTAIVELNHVFFSATQAKKPLSWKDYHEKLKFNITLGMRISMAWDTDFTDIDLHVIEPTKEEVYYSHNLSAIGGKISRDFTSGYGPEEYMLRKAMKGTYNVSAKFFANHSKSLTGGTTILLSFFKNYMTPEEEKKLVTLRMTNNQSKVHVCTINY